MFFSPRNLDQAKSVILTAEDTTTERRWEIEAPYLVDIMLDHINLGALSRVMDYGCGIGRISKELIARCDCRVYGVDFSPAMRALAAGYVEHPHFLSCAPEMIVDLPNMDAVVCVWVLQHIPDPEPIILRLAHKLRQGRRAFIVNSHKQVFPISDGRWLINDEVDVLKLFRSHMKEVAFGDHFDVEKTSPSLSTHGWWGVFEAK